MNKLFITAAILAVSVSAAEAKCTKKSLNGSWSLGAAGGSGAILGSASGGTFTFTIGGDTLTLNRCELQFDVVQGQRQRNGGGHANYLQNQLRENSRLGSKAQSSPGAGD